MDMLFDFLLANKLYSLFLFLLGFCLGVMVGCFFKAYFDNKPITSKRFICCLTLLDKGKKVEGQIPIEVMFKGTKPRAVMCPYCNERNNCIFYKRKCPFLKRF